jgi:hypothetical protein
LLAAGAFAGALGVANSSILKSMTHTEIASRILAAANLGYGREGAVALNWAAAHSAPTADAPECSGDTLARFVALELGDVLKGQTSLRGAVEESLVAIDGAIRDIPNVAAALRELPDDPEADGLS